jgi:hypothetical protein
MEFRAKLKEWAKRQNLVFERYGLKQGDKVIFTNEYGVKFEQIIYGFLVEPMFKAKHDIITNSDSFWFPNHIDEIKKIKS